MSQFVSSDGEATISILTDDEDSSENEIYSRTEPETDSRSAESERPMIGRRNQSRDGDDDQSDACEGLLHKDGISKRQHVAVSRNGDQSMETGSTGCFGTSLSPSTMYVLCMLFAAFPVHFPSVLLPEIRSTDVTLRVTVCLAIAGAIASSITSQLAFKMAALNFRKLLLGGCVGVAVFAVIRCFLAVPEAVLGCGSFVAGFLLTEVRVAAASCCAAPSSTLDGDGLQPRRRSVDASTYLTCGLLILSCSAVGPFISASMHLMFLETYRSTIADDADVFGTPLTTSLTTSPVTSFPASNATLGLKDVDANLSTWSNITISDTNTSSVATPTSTPSSESAISLRLDALLYSYVICSIAALLVVLRPFDVNRQWKSKSPWSVYGVCRLVLGPFNAFRRQDVALLSPLALFVGAQQMFAYSAYIQVS